MPRCQRTFLRLGNHMDKRETAAGRDNVWRCPHCADAEIYEAVTDPDLLAYARFAEAQHVRDFGAPQDGKRPWSLLLGLRPECVLELSDRRYDIYLNRGSDFHQLRLQVGHEMFHRVCSQGRIFHWTHEMLACLSSVALLRRHGLTKYADRVDAWYREQADALPFAEMTATNLLAGVGSANSPDVPPDVPPDAIYARAYVTGAALMEVVGYETLCKLACNLRRDGTPDVEGWIRKLDVLQRQISAHILGITVDTPK